MSDLASRLASIRVLWRQPDLLALWGIPYEMRVDVGQTPLDLWRARQKVEEARLRASPFALGLPKPIDLSDWIWLGQPGWWGGLSRVDRTAIDAWLATLPPDAIPGNPCEWTRLADFGR